MYKTVLKAAVYLVVLLFPGESSASEDKTKVLILGAGLSGITAAKTLLDNDITDFLVIEGKNYTGGRIHAVPFGDLMVEVGANWIQYTEEDAAEPLLKRKNDRKMNGIWANYSDFLIRDESGRDVTGSEYVQKYDTVVNDRLEEFVEARTSRGGVDIPARVGLQLMGWRNVKPIENVLEYYNIDFEYAKRPELVSFSTLFPSGTDFFVSDPRGFWSMYEDLYKPLTKYIRLNKTVNKIKYSPTSVEVHTSDGQVFTSDYALCTFSSGVLAGDMVSFEPPLPEDKKEAIFKKPMGVYTKIFLKFPRKFWDDHEFILYASRQRGRWPVFQDLDRPGILPNGSAVLLITVTEDEGRRVETQAYDETQAEIMKTLREIYGESIPDPTAIYYNRWSQDPHTLGAFSDPVVGFSSQDNEKLGENLGRLYFSGEATSEEWYGYQQGAYDTGKEKAQMIADEVLGVTKQDKDEKPSTMGDVRLGLSQLRWKNRQKVLKTS